MKKKLEAELLSIAHRVLRLKNKDDIGQLQQEALRLYEKLSVLKFVEENLGNPDKAEAKAIAEQKLEEAYQTPVAPETEPVVTEAPKADEMQEEEKEEATPVAEPTVAETAQEEVAEEPKQEEEQVDAEVEEPVKEAPKKEVQEAPKEEIKEETYGHDIVFDKKQEEQEKPVAQTEDLFEEFKNYKEPEFVKVDDDVPDVVPTSDDWQSWVPKTGEEETPAKEPKTTTEASAMPTNEKEDKPVDTPAEKPVSTPNAAVSFAAKPSQRSLNDALGKAINLGLNDRIAFEKHLFAGNSEDLNRVLSQLNTFDNFEDAQNFVNSLIKPDYNNWEGKEEYEERFMSLVEKKFD
ncbi:hypothetical protein GCM10007424_28500 [Flavobacterium suaedae]|uniref:DUF4476 domain-containing protein n=1 Tax=Flavobacterium suaedae TaxID=1767027 RepID=A0ABQ1K512_9FLAO|nr:hypothetical protein [Flavobacterium suaedae]GGB86728.1 hypothetical protein GCM10007424_28500 [Flavobacterium suaedae]